MNRNNYILAEDSDLTDIESPNADLNNIDEWKIQTKIDAQVIAKMVQKPKKCHKKSKTAKIGLHRAVKTALYNPKSKV